MDRLLGLTGAHKSGQHSRGSSLFSGPSWKGGVLVPLAANMHDFHFFHKYSYIISVQGGKEKKHS